MTLIDIEEINKKYDRVISSTLKCPDENEMMLYKGLVTHLLSMSTVPSEREFKMIKKSFDFNGKNSFLFHVYRMLVERKLLPQDEIDHNRLRKTLRIKECKSHSGVIVITVFMSANPEYEDDDGNIVVQPFSCQWNCAYCPNEPGQPRSYLKGEPGVLRANKNDFDCVRQMWDRMNALYNIGHDIDKLEVLVLGGTLTSYPLKYREQFCRDIYYSANQFWNQDDPRPKRSLEDEKVCNQTAKCRVIGLTLETRPDTINPNEIRLLRSYGCTRVQLGVQHTHDDVLKKINRRCTREQFVDALRLLKNCCYKVDTHWMPNLPGSNHLKDRSMLIDELLGLRNPIPKRGVDEHGYHWECYDVAFPDVQADQWKVYPCATVPWTDIEKWYAEGSYIPYDEKYLEDILLDMKSLIFPWIRLNRIIRDIPTDYIIASSDKPNMRQELHDILKKEGKRCRCIRCREVKTRSWDGLHTIMIRKYNASDGVEYFISAENEVHDILYGFVRLRLSQTANDVFPELEGCALIRELHVYGNLCMVSDSVKHDKVQHKGIGKKLMHIAHSIAKQNGYTKIAVIAGEGTKQYYKKLGYVDSGCFMVWDSTKAV